MSASSASSASSSASSKALEGEFQRYLAERNLLTTTPASSPPLPPASSPPLPPAPASSPAFLPAFPPASPLLAPSPYTPWRTPSALSR